MAKNNNTILLLAAGAAAFLFIRSRNKPTRRGEVFVDPVQTVAPGSEAWTNQPDAIIDADKQSLSLPEALSMAKDVAAQVKDALVVIKSKKKKMALRTGRKKVKNTFNRKIRRINMKGLNKKQRKGIDKLFSKQGMAQLTHGM